MALRIFLLLGLCLSPILCSMAQVPGQANVRYGPDPRHLLDLCPAKTSGPSTPAVLMIHGGGWNAGHKEDFAGLCRYFGEHGVTAATMEYRFADGSVAGAWPAQLVDAQLAVRWLRAHAQGLNVDPQRICAYGHSAGAHIAVFLAATSRTLSAEFSTENAAVSSAIACAVDNFGPADFTTPSPFQGVLTRFFPAVDEQMRQHVAREASPLLAIGHATAPIFIAHGFSDTAVPVAQSLAVAEALRKEKVKVTLVAFEGGHEFTGLTPRARSAILELELDFILRTPPR